MNPCATARIRHPMLLVAAAILALVASLAAPAPAEAVDGAEYVALGDSFSAGTGTRAPVDECYRSPYGYPALLAGAHGLDLDYQACSGADTADVLASQVDTLSAATGRVTMTIGGNDIGFADIITECALPGWLSDCYGEIAGARAVMAGPLPGRLDGVYAAIDAGAPNAIVAMAGYPHLFSGRDCSWWTFFSRREMRELNRGTDELNALIGQRSAAFGFTFVGVVDDFDGHAWCDSDEWINGLSWPTVESYHPNRAGNVGYATAFQPALGLGLQALSLPRTAQAEQESVRRPSLQERAQVVLDMELTSRANLRQARAEGVNVQQIRRAVRKLESGTRRQMRTALRQLQRLDTAHATTN